MQIVPHNCNNNAAIMNKQPISRAPRGVVSARPVYVRLMPAELETLTQLARQQNCSLASMARRILLHRLNPIRAVSPLWSDDPVARGFAQAFAQARAPRSTEYQAGVLAALRWRFEGVPVCSPYPAGSAAADAFDAGLSEGQLRDRQDPAR